MNKQEYNNVIETTIAQQSGEKDSLQTTREVLNNMGVVLPQGNLQQVSEGLATDDYMGWRKCSVKEAQEYANEGTAVVAIGNEQIALVAANDDDGEGEVAVNSAEVMTLDENTSALAVADMAFYANIETRTSNRDWRYYATLVVNTAIFQADKTYADFVENPNANDSAAENGIIFNKDFWCVDFVRWCFKEAGVYKSNIIHTTSSSTVMRNWYRDNQPSRFHVGSQGIQAGDIVFIKSNSTSTTPYHTCIAVSSLDQNNKVNTINGNWHDESIVDFQMVPFSGGQIGWYVHPNYEAANN